MPGRRSPAARAVEHEPAGAARQPARAASAFHFATVPADTPDRGSSNASSAHGPGARGGPLRDQAERVFCRYQTGDTPARRPAAAPASPDAHHGPPRARAQRDDAPLRPRNSFAPRSMTLALQTESDTPTPTELLLHFLERVEDWSDPAGVASAATAMLRERLKHPVASVFRFDAEPRALQLLAAPPLGAGGMAPGIAHRAGRGALSDAVRSREAPAARSTPTWSPTSCGASRATPAPSWWSPSCAGERSWGRSTWSTPRGPARPREAEAVVELLTQPLAVALEIDAARSTLSGTGGDESGCSRRRRSRPSPTSSPEARTWPPRSSGWCAARRSWFRASAPSFSCATPSGRCSRSRPSRETHPSPRAS